MSMLKHIATILVVLLSIIGPAGASAPVKSIMWAEKLQRYADRPPTEWGMEYWIQVDKEAALEAFQSVVSKYGPDGRAYAGLARCQTELGYYRNALQSYKAAQRLLPGHKSTRHEILNVQEYLHVADFVKGHIPKDSTVLQVKRWSVDRNQHFWACLSSVKKKWDFGGSWQYSNIRLTIVNKQNGKFRLFWQSDKLGSGALGTDYNDFNVVGLLVINLSGEGLPQIMIQKTITGASAAPTHLDIFAWRNGRIIKLIGVSSELPFTYHDFNHDDCIEICGYHTIGYGLAHAEQPYWKDIYAYKSGYYQLANGDFPKQYKDLSCEIRQALKKYPSDWELLKYKRIVNRITHKVGR
jgi:tetratricopeptide (TPR) repeat protein